MTSGVVGESVEHGQGLGDPWGELAEGRPRVAVRRDVEGRVQVGPGVASPRPDLVARRLARSHVGQAATVR